MVEKLKVRKSFTGKSYIIWCEGCQQTHSFDVREDGGQPTWEFNGNMEKPTFTPSLRYPRCHLILTDGIIHYCGDCYHHLCSLDVPLAEF